MRYLGLYWLILCCFYSTPEATHSRRHGGHVHKTKRYHTDDSSHVIVKKTEIEGPGSTSVPSINEKRGFLANLANLLTEAEELSSAKGDHDTKADGLENKNNTTTNQTQSDNSVSASVVVPQHSKNQIKEIQVNASKDTEIPSVAPIFAYYHGKIVPLGEVNENSFKSKKQKSMLMDNKELLTELKKAEEKNKHNGTSDESADKIVTNKKDEKVAKNSKDENEDSNAVEKEKTEDSKVVEKTKELSKQSNEDEDKQSNDKHHTKHKITVGDDNDLDNHETIVASSKGKAKNENGGHDMNWEEPEIESKTKSEKQNSASDVEKHTDKEEKPLKNNPEEVAAKEPEEEEQKTKDEVKKLDHALIETAKKEEKEVDAITPKHMKPKPRIPKPSDDDTVEEESAKEEKSEAHPSFESKTNSVDENASRRGSAEALPRVKSTAKSAAQKSTPQAQDNHGLSVLNQTQYKRLLHYLSTLEGKSKTKEPTPGTAKSSTTTTTEAIAKDEVSFPDSTGSQKSEVLDHVKGILLDNGKVVPFAPKPTGGSTAGTETAAAASTGNEIASLTTDATTDAATSHGESERFSVSEDGGLIPLNKEKPAVTGESATRDLNPSSDKTVSLSIDMLKGLLRKADSKVSLAQLLNRAASSDADKKQNTQEEDPGTIEDFATNGLAAHNEFRKQHHAPELLWSDDLASKAQKFAEELADKKTLEISKDLEKDGSGENVAKVWATFKTAGAEATKMWASQASNFRFDDPHLDENTGQFAQVVWKDTKELGMGVAKSIDDVNNRYVYVVALYHPAGNMEPTLRENVLPTGNNTVDVYSTFFKRTATKRSEVPHHDDFWFQ